MAYICASQVWTPNSSGGAGQAAMVWALALTALRGELCKGASWMRPKRCATHDSPWKPKLTASFIALSQPWVFSHHFLCAGNDFLSAKLLLATRFKLSPKPEVTVAERENKFFTFLQHTLGWAIAVLHGARTNQSQTKHNKTKNLKLKLF